MSKLFSVFSILLLLSATAFSQNAIIDGYVYEKHNRGFLNEVKVTILDNAQVFVGEVMSDIDGHYTFPVPAGKEYILDFSKKIFQLKRQTVSTKDKVAGESVFVKTELERQPGYLLEVTLAEKRFSEDVNVDAVHGSRIEIYNHSTKKEELVIDSAKTPVFSITLQQGNEYTIMVRKKGFYNKRLHANVNINGCYLCMDGFGTVNPGVVSNLTSAENNKLGTLLSNVEMERIDTTRNIVIQNIYYTYNSAELYENATKELDKVIQLLKTNPSLVVELGSHTDSRGSDEFNKILSQQRAQAAVDHILSSPWVESNRLKAKGYGESRLMNKCEDGITCTDQEHQQNRRTELRIIGFTQDPYAEKSLLEIIHQEELMAFVNSGDGEKIYTTSDKPETKATENPEIKQPVEKPKTEAVTPPSRLSRDVPSVQKPKMPEKSISETPIKEATKQTPKLKEANMTVNLKTIGDYSGYKVEMFTASNSLGVEDPDLKMIAQEVASDIFVDKLASGGFSYSVGSFQNWGETERFLEKIVQKYPKAKIVDYFKGKRVGQ